MKKLLIAILSVALFSISSCTTRTCPTYANNTNDIDPEYAVFAKDAVDVAP
jgi:hypothetical protein